MSSKVTLEDMQKYIPFLEFWAREDNTNKQASEKLLKFLKDTNLNSAKKKRTPFNKIEKIIIDIYNHSKLKSFTDVFKPTICVTVSSSDESDDEIKFRRCDQGNATDEENLFVRRSDLRKFDCIDNNKNLRFHCANNKENVKSLHSIPIEIIEITDSDNDNDKLNNDSNKNKENLNSSIKFNNRDPRLLNRFNRRSIYSALGGTKNNTEELNMEFKTQEIGTTTTPTPQTNFDKLEDNNKLKTPARIKKRRETLGIFKEYQNLMKYTEECFDAEAIKDIIISGRKRRHSTFISNSETNTQLYYFPSEPKKLKPNPVLNKKHRKSLSTVNETKWRILEIPEPKKIEPFQFTSSDSDSSVRGTKIKPLILSKRNNVIVSDEEYDTEDFEINGENQIVKSCQVQIPKLNLLKLSDYNRAQLEDLNKSYKLGDSMPLALPIVKQVEITLKNRKRSFKGNDIKNINKEMCFLNDLFGSCYICKKNCNDLVQHYVCEHPKFEVLNSRLDTNLIRQIEENPIIGTANDEFNKRFNVKCIFCNKNILETIQKLYEHYASHTGEFAYECLGCNIKSPYEKVINEHVKLNKCKSAKKNQLYAYANDVNQLFAYSCQKCNFIQLNEGNIKRHLTNEHEVINIDSKFIKPLLICKIEYYTDFNLIKLEDNYEIRNKINETLARVVVHSFPDKNRIGNENCSTSNTKAKLNSQDTSEFQINKNKIKEPFPENVAAITINNITSNVKEKLHLKTKSKCLNKQINVEIPSHVPIEERFICSEAKCLYKGNSEDLLEEHFSQIHRKLKSYKCSFCKFSIENEVNDFKLIKDHLRMHSGNLYICGKCNHTSHCRFDLTKHMREKHKMETSFTHIKRHINYKNELISMFTSYFENNENNFNIHFCPICCKSVIENIENLNNHLKINHECRIIYQCIYCKLDCGNVPTMQSHILEKHRGRPLSICCVYKTIEKYNNTHKSSYKESQTRKKNLNNEKQIAIESNKSQLVNKVYSQRKKKSSKVDRNADFRFTSSINRLISIAKPKVNKETKGLNSKNNMEEKTFNLNRNLLECKKSYKPCTAKSNEIFNNNFDAEDQPIFV